MAKGIVLGGGPGGYAAAFALARGGVEVTLIERARLGGTCLNVGCIPTKTILRSAHTLHELRRADDFAIKTDVSAHLDLAALRTRKEGIVDQLVAQVEASAGRLKVKVIHGTGRLTGKREVTVTAADNSESVHEADVLIIATGSLPFILPALDASLLWTSDDAVALRELPTSIVIIGGGVIGVEFASAYAAFGVETTVVELAPTLLPGNDRRVTTALAKSLQEQGIALHLGDSVQAVTQTPDGLCATLASGAQVTAQRVLCAVGRVPNTAGFGFEEVGLNFDRRALAVDECFRTNLPGVYAIGDVIGGVMLAHAAEAEGEAAAHNALAQLAGQEPGATVDNHLIPGCIYTLPEIATVGLSAEAAKQADIPAVTGVAKYAGNGKALAEGESEGFVQLVAEKQSGKLLGAQIVGAKAVELVAVAAQALADGADMDRLASHIYAHPTLAEIIKAAALITAEKLAR